MSVLATILAAAEAGAEHTAEAAEHEKSELPFFLVGGTLASFAVIISVVGFKKPDFPGNAGAARGLMALSITLVLATMVSIVYVAN
jgi:hypothetical protein